MTVREALAWAAGRINPNDRENGRQAALFLLQEATGLCGAPFYDSLEQQLPPQALAEFQDYVGRAASGEPVQYILGHWEFYGYRFKTDQRALIPRPETERLVEEALRAIPDAQPSDVIDAGCGTGCIGITVKLKRPLIRMTVCDVSREALALAGENAASLGANVKLLQADMRQCIPGGPYDAILSNPPYINSADMETLPCNVRCHEPRLALHGGVDGLDFVRALADRAFDSLKTGGRLLVEIGYDQAERALRLMELAGLEASAIPDYAGIPRVITARKV